MAKFNQAFKVQCVKKVLSKRSEQTVKDIADHLRTCLGSLSVPFFPARNYFLKIK